MSTGKPMVAIEYIRDRSGFDDLREEWTELLRESAADSLFLTWEWLRTWWQHLSGGRRLFIVAVRREGRLLAIAPLANRPGAFTRLLPILEFLGVGTVGSDYLDIIVRRGSEAEVREALAREMRAWRASLALGQLKEEGSAMSVAQRLAEERFTVSRERTDVCPFIPLLGHSFDSYLGTLGSEHRYNFRRRLRNLEKKAAVRFEKVEDEEGRKEALSALFALHDERWRTRGGSDAFDAAGILAFHEEFSRLALRLGWLRLFVLRVDGQPAATLYGFRHGRTFSFYQSGWDPRFAARSVGLVTLGLAIRSALEEGAEEFDLLHGSESYKFHWAREVRPLARIEAYPPGARGFALRNVVAADRAGRRLARQVLGDQVSDGISQARRLGIWRALRAATAR
jgi:CelD/BcsL family acetyltransferase involved in cellulose biosynthesis